MSKQIISKSDFADAAAITTALKAGNTALEKATDLEQKVSEFDSSETDEKGQLKNGGYYNTSGEFASSKWGNYTDKISLDKVTKIVITGSFVGAYRTLVYDSSNNVVKNISEGSYKNQPYELTIESGWENIAFSFSTSDTVNGIVFYKVGKIEELETELNDFIDNEGDFAPKVIPSFEYLKGATIKINKDNVALDGNEQGIVSGAEQEENTINITSSTAGTVNYDYFVFANNMAKYKYNNFSVNYKEETDKSLKVLLLGDSTIDTLVNGSAVTEGRIVHYLKSILGDNLTLIGDRGEAPYVHSGHGGWRAADYAYKAYRGTDTSDVNPYWNTSLSTDSKFDFGYYLEQKSLDTPDVVVIQLGINDVTASSKPEYGEINAASYVDSMQIIVDRIKAYNSDIVIIVDLVLPPTKNWSGFEVYKSGYLSPQIAHKYTIMANCAIIDALSDVKFLPINAILDRSSDFEDRVHPNSGGYEKIATMIANLLKTL